MWSWNFENVFRHLGDMAWILCTWKKLPVRNWTPITWLSLSLSLRLFTALTSVATLNEGKHLKNETRKAICQKKKKTLNICHREICIHLQQTQHCYQSHITAPDTNVLLSNKTQRKKATCDSGRYWTVSSRVYTHLNWRIDWTSHRHQNTGWVRLCLGLLQQTFLVTSTEHWIQYFPGYLMTLSTVH